MWRSLYSTADCQESGSIVESQKDLEQGIHEEQLGEEINKYLDIMNFQRRPLKQPYWIDIEIMANIWNEIGKRMKSLEQDREKGKLFSFCIYIPRLLKGQR